MAETTLDIKGLDKLAADLDRVRKAAPDLLLKQINRAGNKFRRESIEETRHKVKKRKGNLLKGYRKKIEVTRSGLGIDYEAQITGGNRKARHFHLIENGHRQTAETFFRVGYKAVYHSKEGYVKGYKIIGTVRDKWQSEQRLVKYGEAAVREALRKGAID